MKKLIILGESHTRSFAYRKNIFPFFMGSGMYINLDKSNITKVNTKIKEVLSTIDKSECDQVFITNSIFPPSCWQPQHTLWSDKISYISIAPVIAETIRRIQVRNSLSQLTHLSFL